MSSTLIKRALCMDPADYESLLASLSVVKSVLDCDTAGNVAEGPATDILKKLFEYGDTPEVNGSAVLWFSKDGKHTTNEDPAVNFHLAGADGERDVSGNLVTAYKCYEDFSIFYYKKGCDLGECEWKPKPNDCLDKAIDIVNAVIETDIPANPTFTEIACGFSCYLGKELASTKPPLADAIAVIDAFCSVLIERASTKRSLNKAALTINDCDF